MSISDRLSEIRARIVRARQGRHTDRHMVLDVDAPALVEAVRAVFDLHRETSAPYDTGYCAGCNQVQGFLEDWPCPTIQAIEAALGEDS